MKTIDLLDEGMKAQLKDIILAFWDRRIDGVSFKLQSSEDEYNELEIYSNWLINLFQELLDEDIKGEK